MENIAKRTFWRDAAKAGAVAGLVLVVTNYMSVWFNSMGIYIGWILSLIQFFGLAYCIYTFSRNRGLIYGSAGYSYGQSMSFIAAMMLFAGFIYGVGYFLLINIFAADYFAGVFEAAMETTEDIVGYDVFNDEGMVGMRDTVKNPFIWIFSGIMGIEIYGLLIGLFASVFVKRQPNIFPDENQGVNE